MGCGASTPPRVSPTGSDSVSCYVVNGADDKIVGVLDCAPGELLHKTRDRLVDELGSALPPSWTMAAESDGFVFLYKSIPLTRRQEQLKTVGVVAESTAIPGRSRLFLRRAAPAALAAQPSPRSGGTGRTLGTRSHSNPSSPSNHNRSMSFLKAAIIARHRTATTDGDRFLPGAISELPESPRLPSDSPAAEASELCTYFEGPRAILVTDMSGFTRVTRKHGIIHYATLILNMRRIFHRVFGANSSEHWMTEADNCFAVFPTCSDALRAVLEAQLAIAAYNESVPSNGDFAIKIGGWGLAWGDNIVKSHSNHLFGGVVHRAFLLGEDIASNDICADEHFVMAIHEESHAFGRLVVPQIAQSEMLTNHSSHVDDEFNYRPLAVRNVEALPLRHEEIDHRVAADEVKAGTPRDKYPNAKEMELLMRLNVLRDHKAQDRADQAAAAEAALSAEFMEKGRCVLIFGLAYDHVTQEHGVRQMLRVRSIVERLLRPVYNRHHGEPTWDEFNLVVFRDAADALACTLAVRRVVGRWNRTCRPADNIPIDGYGIHTGQLLVVPGTNVHWGDAVNTASKLGEDFARSHEVVISEQIFEAVNHNPKFSKVIWESRTVEISKVKFSCYCIS